MRVSPFVALRGRVCARWLNPETYRVTLPLLFLPHAVPFPDMKTMLIIDGSEIISMFSELFESRGWSVDVCFDRQCALERLTGDWPYDAIIAGRVSETAEVELVGMIRGFDHRRTAALRIKENMRILGIDSLSEPNAAGFYGGSWWMLSFLV
jgi:hypothetical protein